jgi:endonuclease/exonuclease/phosphatase family metal-dependent hydrolase
MKYVAIGLGAIALAAAGTVGWAFATEHDPEPIETVTVDCPSPGAPLQAGQTLELVSWNLQYGASRKHQFFYDGGDAVYVPDEDVQWTLDAANAVMAAVQPDLFLLQEVDRDSKRTGRVDQHDAYVAGQSAGCHAAAPYHKSPFVPAPSNKPLGRVDMELSLLTHAPLLNATRVQLALKDDAKAVQMFDLKRAMLWGEVEVEGLDQPLAIAVTHLSAFSFGDGTLEKQVGQLQDWIEARPEGQPWILAGDFNLLPPGDDKMRLEHERELYSDDVNPIDVMFDAGYTEVFGDDQLNPEHRTYLPFGEAEPDRKIDYVFVGGPLEVLEAEVLRDQASEISDHLPVRVKLKIVDPNAPPEPEPEPIEAEPDAASTEGGDAEPADAPLSE